MKFKKGQVAVFVILGIVIVAGIILLIRPDVLKAGVSSEVEPIYSFVQQCLDETSRQAVIYVSERGGYYNVPEQSFAETTPYYLYEGTNLMPSKGIIAEELSLYVNENIGYCLNDFFSFPDFIIERSEIKSDVEIGEGVVVFDLNYPLSIIKEEESYTLEDFNVEIPVRLDVVYDAVFEIMQEEVKDVSAVNSHKIYEVSLEKDISVKMISLDEESTAFVVTDKNSKINEEDFVFIFANKYEFMEA